MAQEKAKGQKVIPWIALSKSSDQKYSVFAWIMDHGL